MRIGQGFDVHRLVPGRRLVLGGVEIPYELGLLGHSDADVLAHAVIDALLGAVGAGDIGQLFPDTDPRYLNADSLQLMRHVAGIIAEKGLRLVNLDGTIIAQKPKLAQFIPPMREKMAAAMGAEPELISIKATTTEGLGFTGRGEGIAAMAVVLLE